MSMYQLNYKEKVLVELLDHHSNLVPEIILNLYQLINGGLAKSPIRRSVLGEGGLCRFLKIQRVHGF